jgi:hypothetical protein
MFSFQTVVLVMKIMMGVMLAVFVVFSFFWHRRQRSFWMGIICLIISIAFILRTEMVLFDWILLPIYIVFTFAFFADYCLTRVKPENQDHLQDFLVAVKQSKNLEAQEEAFRQLQIRAIETRDSELVRAAVHQTESVSKKAWTRFRDICMEDRNTFMLLGGLRCF